MLDRLVLINKLWQLIDLRRVANPDIFLTSQAPTGALSLRNHRKVISTLDSP
jgi:hypothetical protein